MKRKQDVLDLQVETHVSPKRSKPAQANIFDRLSEELCFHCLSYLDQADLLAASETSRYLNRLASDNHLWKALYARQFLDQNVDNAWFARQDGLPTRTWRELFRIAHNWKVGRARTTRLPIRSSVLPEIGPSEAFDALEDIENAEESATSGAEQGTGTSLVNLARKRQTKTQEPAKVVWHGQNYFVASKDLQDGGLPSVDIFEITPSSDSPKKIATAVSSGLKGKGSPESINISEIQLDAVDYGKNGIRLAVFYSNGQFSIFRIRGTGRSRTTQDALHIVEEYFSSQTTSRPTVMARLHSPILVTSSSDCSVRVKFLEEVRNSESGLTELFVTTSAPTMRTRFCFAPMSMRLTQKDQPLTDVAKLKAQQNPQRFALTLAYSTPYYPAAFTVGLQTFHITVPAKPKGATQQQQRRRLEVFGRSALAVPPHSASSQAVINTIEHDGPYIVASRSDNTISVYRIVDTLADSWSSSVDPSSDPPSPSPAQMHTIPLSLRHVRTLFGHTSAVDAVSVLNGRCVSTGRDGIKVWDLPPHCQPRMSSIDSGDDENDLHWKPNTPISEKITIPTHESKPKSEMIGSGSKCRWIGLDTSRIVTVSQDEAEHERLIKVYHFE